MQTCLNKETVILKAGSIFTEKYEMFQQSYCCYIIDLFYLFQE